MKSKCDWLIKHTQCLYCVALAVFVISLLLESTLLSYDSEVNGNGFFNQVLQLMRYSAYGISLLLICTNIINKQYSHTKLTVYLISFLITAASSFVTQDKTYMLYTLLFIAAEKIPTRKIFLIYFTCQLVVLLSMSIGTQLGLITDIVLDIRSRSLLGFRWSSYAPYYLMFIEMSYIALKCGKLKWYEGLSFVSFATWLFYKTNSRFAFILTIFISVFFMLYHVWPQLNHLLSKHKRIIVLLPFVIAIGAILLHYCYDSSCPFMKALNSLLSHRLRLGSSAISEYGFSLLGNPNIQWIGNGLGTAEGAYNYVDCSYLQILLSSGILVLSLILVIYSIILWLTLAKEKYYLTWLVLCVMLFAIFEPRLANMTYNPFMLLCVTEADGKWDKQNMFFISGNRNGGPS